MSVSSPVVIGKDGTVEVLQRLPLTGNESSYNELFIQELAFNNVACLPIAEIDSDYQDLVPLCTEMNTPAGPIDALYITRSGKLALLEAKLWRSPESRRKVIGQILDYAKELTALSYDDLQREILRRIDLPEKSLYAYAEAKFPGLEEIAFVDGVSRSLESGRFLLLVLGDGIREGAASIASFLQSFGRLDFSFGLLELGLFELPDGSLLVQPQVLAKTLVIERHVVEIRSDGKAVDIDAATEDDPELSDLQTFYPGFWSEWLEELDLDDSSQPKPSPSGFRSRGNVFLSMPPSGTVAWITIFFLQAENRVGVFLTFAKGQFGNEAYDDLLGQRVEIESEI